MQLVLTKVYCATLGESRKKPQAVVNNRFYNLPVKNGYLLAHDILAQQWDKVCAVWAC